jgi:hypothetical protein
LVVALVIVLAGVVVNLLCSATPALSFGLLLAAAALITLALLLLRGRAKPRRVDQLRDAKNRSPFNRAARRQLPLSASLGDSRRFAVSPGGA